MKRFICLLSLILFFGLVSSSLAEEETYQDSLAMKEMQVAKDLAKNGQLDNAVAKYLEIRDKYAETTFYAAGRASTEAAYYLSRQKQYEQAMECYRWVIDNYGREDIDSIPDFQTQRIAHFRKMEKATAYHAAEYNVPVIQFYMGDYASAKKGFEGLLKKYKDDFPPFPSGIPLFLNSEDYFIFKPLARNFFGENVNIGGVRFDQDYYSDFPPKQMSLLMVQFISIKLKQKEK